MLSSLSAWVLSIAGIIVLCVLVELIMPSGQMNKYIKGILSFMVVFVIVMPIPKLLNLKIDFNDFLNYGNVEVDKDYIYQLNLNKMLSLKEDIEGACLTKGYDNVIVSLDADVLSTNFHITKAVVDLTGLVITSNAVHSNILDIKKDIAMIIKKILSLEEEDIYFDE